MGVLEVRKQRELRPETHRNFRTSKRKKETDAASQENDTWRSHARDMYSVSLVGVF